MTDQARIIFDGKKFDPTDAQHVARLGQVIAEVSGEGAVVIVMIGKNGRPHSSHLVSWEGSCMEVRGLLAQGTDVIQHEVHGLNLRGEGDPPLPKCLELGWRNDGSEFSVRHLLGKLRELEAKLESHTAVASNGRSNGGGGVAAHGTAGGWAGNVGGGAGFGVRGSD